MEKIIIHKDRSILEISGADRKFFLQGLITNDINKASSENLIYTAMLNSQGRFLYDFFIFEHEEKLFLDCFSARRDEILQKFNFYKLRSKVEITSNDALFACQAIDETENLFCKMSPKFSFTDPRKIGKRFYVENFYDTAQDAYHLARIMNKIPESEYDLTYEKSFILEFGFDDLNAIDYNKGCYLGQEITARTHHTGQIRKKIIVIKICDSGDINVKKNDKIFYCKKEVGIILSSIKKDKAILALALIRDEFSLSDDEYELELETGERIVKQKA
jgi:folate-binding protein YgfZ